MKANVNDIFARLAADNRAASLANEKPFDPDESAAFWAKINANIEAQKAAEEDEEDADENDEGPLFDEHGDEIE